MAYLARAVLLIDGEVGIEIVVCFVDILLPKEGQQSADKYRYSDHSRPASRNGRRGQSSSLSFTSVKAAIGGR